jgi:hypothetical protein
MVAQKHVGKGADLPGTHVEPLRIGWTVALNPKLHLLANDLTHELHFAFRSQIGHLDSCHGFCALYDEQLQG